MTALDREGTFESRVTNAEMYTSESGAIAVNLSFEVLRQYDKATKQYIDWPAGYFFKGSVWIVKKDEGGVIPENIKRLKRSIGWNGNPDDIGAVIGAVCKCDVKLDTYKPEYPEYKMAYLNPAGGPDISKITEQYAHQFMAYAAEVGHIQPATTGATTTAPSTPTPAPTPAPPQPPQPPAAELVQQDPNDEIGF